MVAGLYMASRVEDGGSLDYFPSPPWWGRALGEVLDQLGLGPVERKRVHEPACGEGHLVHGLKGVFGQVTGSDIYDYPGRVGVPGFRQVDFLADSCMADLFESGCQSRERPDWIVTNPPFGVRTGPFIRRAMQVARVGCAVAVQLRLLEGPGRYALFLECGLYAAAVIPRGRSGLRKGLWTPGLSTATAYVWLIFVRPGVVPGWTGFAGEARTVWIDPHAGRRLTQPDDDAFAGLMPRAGS